MADFGFVRAGADEADQAVCSPVAPNDKGSPALSGFGFSPYRACNSPSAMQTLPSPSCSAANKTTVDDENDQEVCIPAAPNDKGSPALSGFGFSPCSACNSPAAMLTVNPPSWALADPNKKPRRLQSAFETEVDVDGAEQAFDTFLHAGLLESDHTQTAQNYPVPVDDDGLEIEMTADEDDSDYGSEPDDDDFGSTTTARTGSSSVNRKHAHSKTTSTALPTRDSDSGTSSHALSDMRSKHLEGVHNGSAPYDSAQANSVVCALRLQT
jgi:hypothetical protein